ncbi:MAG: DoxX family membrane protein [Ignavibacteria bacterium]|nr:DoxX family membrane protein [Ignavibacteria bacterium]
MQDIHPNKIMEKVFSNKYFITLAKLVLGSIFIYASLDKIANPEAFAGIIKNYRLLPIQLVNPLAIFLPWLELFTGFLLIVNKWVKASLLIYSTLLIIFVIALSQALVRGLDISCGCFSVQSSSASDIWMRIVEDLILLFVSVNLYRYTETENLLSEKIT